MVVDSALQYWPWASLFHVKLVYWFLGKLKGQAPRRPDLYECLVEGA